jgi:hypothetical protein
MDVGDRARDRQIVGLARGDAGVRRKKAARAGEAIADGASTMRRRCLTAETRPLKSGRTYLSIALRTNREPPLRPLDVLRCRVIAVAF